MEDTRKMVAMTLFLLCVSLVHAQQWTDITKFTPTYYSSRVCLTDKELFFVVINREGEEYQFSFDDEYQIEELVQRINAKDRLDDGQYYVEYVINLFLEETGYEYLTKIHDRRELGPKFIPRKSYDSNTSAMDERQLGLYGNTDHTTSRSEIGQGGIPDNDEDYEEKYKQLIHQIEELLSVGITAIVAIWLLKIVARIFFNIGNKSKDDDSWMDAAWFHDHKQKL